jgi:hypothetical protein
VTGKYNSRVASTRRAARSSGLWRQPSIRGSSRPVIFIGDLIFGVLDLGSLLHHRDVTLITRDCDDSMSGGRASLRG